MQGSSPSDGAAAADAPVRRTHAALFALFLLLFMTDASSGYLMIYLRSIGLNTLEMGILTSAALLVAISVQPFIGRLADRAPSRNLVMSAALCVAMVLLPLLRLSTAFAYVLAVYMCFSIARYAINPLMDTITMEFTSRHGYAFGPIRTMGCLGYAVMSAVAGMVAEKEPGNTFFLYSAMALISLAFLQLIPRSSGGRTREKPSPLILLRMPELRRYILFTLAVMMTRSFYMTFYSVYFTGELGGPTNLYGVLLSLSALAEIPLIFSLDRLIRRFGMRRLILFAASAETLRWFLTGLVLNPYVQLGMQALFGVNNMVLSVTMAMFVNRMMPKEMKAMGQATYSMIISIGSLLAGNLLGGALSNALGMRPVFFLAAGINVVVVALFLGSRRQAPVPEDGVRGGNA